MRTKVLHYLHTEHPDAQAELGRLVAAEKRITRDMAREPLSEGLVADLDAVRDAMESQRAIIRSGFVRITLKGLTRGEFRRVLTAHPARAGDETDARFGYDVDTFGDALVRACLVGAQSLDGEPVPIEWDRWADDMTDGQWEEIFAACMGLTRDPSPAFPQ